MSQDSRHKTVRQTTQSQGILLICKQVLSKSVAQRHIDMHTRSIDPLLGLGHKSGVKSVALCNGLGRHLKGHNVIRCLQGICILQINLMLARSDLMMAGFHLKSHLLQGQHNIPAYIFSQINGRYVKISGPLVGLCCRAPLFIGVKKEKLTLRPHLEHIPHIRRPFDSPLQHIAGIPLKWCAVRIVHVADQPCHSALLRSPWKDLKGVQIRMKVHIRLIDPHKALNGGTIKHTPVIQGLRQLSGRDRHIFKHPENIRKLKTYKLHILLFHYTDNVISAVFAHHSTVLS